MKPENDNDQKPEIVVSDEAKRFMLLVTRGILVGGMEIVKHLKGDPSMFSAVPTPPPEANEIMTADDVAAFLGVDRNTVYEYAARNVIPHKRIGKRLIFRRETIRAWLDSARAISTR